MSDVYVEPSESSLDSVRKQFAIILYRLMKEYKNTKDVLDAIQNPDKYTGKEENALLALPQMLYNRMSGGGEYLYLKMALRRTAGVIALSRRLKEELPSMYLDISQALKVKAQHLGAQLATNENRTKDIQSMLSNKVVSDYNPSEMILSQELKSLEITGGQSKKIREVCDYMSLIYEKLSLSSRSILESVFTNVEASSLIIRSALYHSAIRKGSTQLIENTNKALDVSADFVGSLMNNPRLLLPTVPGRGSKIDALLSRIRSGDRRIIIEGDRAIYAEEGRVIDAEDSKIGEEKPQATAQTQTS